MYLWAIARAGYSVDVYLSKYNLVREWIEGEKCPTVRQLEWFANSVHVPYGYLFLDTPPQEVMPIPLFRGTSNASKLDLNIYETVQTMLYRQEWAEEYIKEQLGGQELSFIKSMSVDSGVGSVVAAIRGLLDLPQDWAFSEKTSASAVNRVAQRMEELGIITSFNGIVGNSTRRKLSVEGCRGFALVSTFAPIIFINNGDAKSAQLFTLIHEFTHLLLGVSAGFGGIEDMADRVEVFCDNVAASFLVPKTLFISQWEEHGGSIDKCAGKFKVSPLVIARRAYALNLISANDYREFYNRYKLTWQSKPALTSGGGSFYMSATKRVGALFGAYIGSAVSSGYLLHREAYRLTGLHGKSFDRVIYNDAFRELNIQL